MPKYPPVIASVPVRTTGIDPIELALVRAQVAAHILATQSLDGLDIAPGRPEVDSKFAFVHLTPKLSVVSKSPEHSLWRRCSYCETNRKWIDGSIVLCSDHRLRLIGPDCWKNHVDEQDWNAATTEFQQYQRIARFKVAKNLYFPTIRALQGEIKTTKSILKSSIDFADRFGSNFRTKFPTLANLLVRAHRDDDRLVVERMSINYRSLEGGRGQAEAQTIDDRVSRSAVVHTIHRLVGGNSIDIAEGAVSRSLDRAFHQANIAMDMSTRDWEAMSDHQFDGAARVFEAACQESVIACYQVLQMMQAVFAFLSGANTTGIATWANDHDCEIWLTEDEGRYESNSRGLVLYISSGGCIRYLLPLDYRLPKLEYLEEMKDLISKRRISRSRKAA